MFKATPNQIDVIVEANSGYDGHLVAMIASKALHEAGFNSTDRVYAPTGQDGRKTLTNTDQYVPSVLDVVRQIDPELFQQTIVIAAHNPTPYPNERRLFDRVLLRAENIALAMAQDEPEQIYNQLQEEEQEEFYS